MNFLLSYVLKSLDSSRVKILSKRNGEKIESYCRSSIFKLEMQKSTSKQPYIFEMETKQTRKTTIVNTRGSQGTQVTQRMWRERCHKAAPQNRPFRRRLPPTLHGGSDRSERCDGSRHISVRVNYAMVSLVLAPGNAVTTGTVIDSARRPTGCEPAALANSNIWSFGGIFLIKPGLFTNLAGFFLFPL